MTDLSRRSERTYYDTFFSSLESERVDQGVGFQLLRRAQADYLCRRLQSFAATGIVLSMGCGNGEIEMLLDDTVGRVFAFDLSLAGLIAGSVRAAQRNLAHLSFGQASVTELPVSTESCDAVLLLSLLHHLQPFRRVEALNEVYRVLRAGGWFIAYDPSQWRAVRLVKFLVRKKYDALHSPDEDEVSPRQMQRLARTIGFDQVQVEFFDLFIDPLTWLCPDMPPRLFKVLYTLDRAFVRVPGRQLASNFFLVGHKPS